MPRTPTKVSAAAREDRGYTSQCSHSNHLGCPGNGCTCPCHVDPSYLERSPAERAHIARRAAARAQASPGSHSPGEVAPNRPQVKPGVKAPIPAAAARQIKSEFSLALWAADQGAARIWPQYWTTPEDRLQDDERTSLVNATYAVLEAYFPQALKVLAKVSESAPLATFLYTVAMVAAPRLAHHKVIPPELASAIIFAPLLFSQPAGEPAGESTPAVDSERAREPDRPNWDGQIDTSGIPVAVPPVQGGVSQQTGHGPLQHGTDHQNGAGNGRYPL